MKKPKKQKPIEVKTSSTSVPKITKEVREL